MKKWYERSFRRSEVDMHIEDWDGRFLSKYDAQRYVDTISLSNSDTAMVYANSHIGLCYWPTKCGQMHKNLRGRDILGEVIELCHGKEMNVVVYYTLIFVNRAYEEHPDWRVITPKGIDAVGLGIPRYGVCCPNTPYRDFALEQVKEIVTGYEFEGLWLDMTFWPDVCYCPACEQRYLREVGKRIPRIINWENPEWVRFQRKREEWLAEFASLFTSTAKGLRPQLTVAHQSLTFMADWRMGPSVELARATDYLSADLHGDNLYQSFASKLFYSLSENQPFEYMTSRCPQLFHHTVMKPPELLEAQAFSALANGGAFQFIDAIDPVGTLDRSVYERIRPIYEKVEKYEPYFGGEWCQDVGIYISFESMFYPEDNDQNIAEITSFYPPPLPTEPTHTLSARGFAKVLLNHNIPYGVLTKKNLGELSRFKIIILPDVVVLDHDEADALRRFVSDGASLFVMGQAARIWKDGVKEEDFLLSDIMGVSYEGETTEFFTYISPTDADREVLSPYTPEYPFGLFSTQVKVKASKGTKVLGTMTLPYTHPADTDHLASIHSNPPGVPTDYPSIVVNRYGKGRVLYLAMNLDPAFVRIFGLDPGLTGNNFELMQDILVNLVHYISPEPFILQSDAPRQVELTLFHQKNKKRYIINILNYQSELPSIPVKGIKVKLRLGRKKPVRALHLPKQKELGFKVEDGYAVITAPKVEMFLMLALDYE